MNAFLPDGSARRAFARGGSAPLAEGPSLLGLATSGWDAGTLWRAWELLRCEPGLDREGQRALFVLALLMLSAEEQGSTRFPLGGPAFDAALERLEAEELRAPIAALLRAAEAGALRTLGDGATRRPLVVEDGFLTPWRLRVLEEGLIERFRERLVGAPAEVEGADADEALERILAAPPVQGGAKVLLSHEQQDAVRLALRAPLAVISGGPGTGKTSIVASILRASVQMGLAPDAIALAAPTGKAANRLTSALQGYLHSIEAPLPTDDGLRAASPQAQTLHRLLGYSPRRGSFHHHEGNPLGYALVIVDEASMIDLGLMMRLMRALHSETRLVLLGDAEQLPSVDAGAVLRDLVPPADAAEGDPRRRAAIRLTHSYRMDARDPSGRSILGAARVVRRGETEGLFEGEHALLRRQRAEEVVFDRVELLGSPERSALLERWYERLERRAGLVAAARAEWVWDGERFHDEAGLRRLFAEVDAQRILCVTRVEPGTGADAVNEQMHELHLHATGGGAAPILPGEPVMVQRNDYERGLFNGDQGLLLRVRSVEEASHSWRLVFPKAGGFAVFPLDALRSNVRLAWAMTVHKSQGSEFDAVVVMLPREPMALLSREILYTALTRSKKSVLILGEPDVLAAGVRHRLERFSGIADALSRPVA